MIFRKRCASRGVLLIEAMVGLFLVGIVVFLGLSLFARRRELEKERLDREIARRALASEWVYLRTSYDVTPRKDGGFVADLVFSDAHHPVAGDAEPPVAPAVLAEASLGAVGLPIIPPSIVTSPRWIVPAATFPGLEIRGYSGEVG